MDKYDSLKLENQLCFPLYALSRKVTKLYKPLLDKYNLTYTQYITMLVIWEYEKISFKDLGQKLYLDSGTLSPVIKRLKNKELIDKFRDPTDDRSVVIELAKKGKEMKKKIIEVPSKMACQITGKDETLIQLKKNLDELLVESEKWD
ncbi:MAG TPA: MarR family transcriptional regulator [Clostridia bacterium]|nr:MarR family transcriptional regulator [Clostridia bacterium]